MGPRCVRGRGRAVNLPPPHPPTPPDDDWKQQSLWARRAAVQSAGTAGARGPAVGVAFRRRFSADAAAEAAAARLPAAAFSSTLPRFAETQASVAPPPTAYFVDAPPGEPTGGHGESPQRRAASASGEHCLLCAAAARVTPHPTPLRLFSDVAPRAPLASAGATQHRHGGRDAHCRVRPARRERRGAPLRAAAAVPGIFGVRVDRASLPPAWGAQPRRRGEARPARGRPAHIRRRGAAALAAQPHGGRRAVAFLPHGHGRRGSSCGGGGSGGPRAKVRGVSSV